MPAAQEAVGGAWADADTAVSRQTMAARHARKRIMIGSFLATSPEL
jgi:hypothetical protein